MLLYPEEAAELLLKYPDISHSVFDPSVSPGPYIYDDRNPNAFEAQFPVKAFRQLFNHYRHYSILTAVLYVAVSLFGVSWMKNRPKYSLRGPLVFWNIVMTVFSGLLTYKIVPLILDKIFSRTSFYGIVCDGRRELTPAATWLVIFASTKVIEFIDTFFIVLRKQPLAFIHWFHHATVVVMAWYTMGANLGPANTIIFAGVNSAIHTVMYAYYGLKAAQVRVPKTVSMAITSMQIAQMFLGLGVNLLSAYYFFFRPHDRPCDEDAMALFVTLTIYSIYLLLFCNFFYNAYVSKTPAKTTKSE